MKRILTLSLIFSLISSFSFAQIRIEKRRYNKGWYVSLNHKKNSADEKPELKPKPATEKKMQAEPFTPAAEQAPAENENLLLAAEPQKENQPDSAVQKPKEKIKTVSAPALSQIKKAVAAPVKMQQSFARNAKSKAVTKADPGDSFFGYLFDSMRSFFIVIGIILGAVALGFLIYGLIVNPVATLLTILAILIYPIISI